VSPVLVIARLTLREAVRRRLVAAFAAITVFLVALSAWGFDRLSHAHSLTSGEVDAALPQALILFMFMFSFVVALSASAMGSPAVAADVESGVLLSMVTRPLRRSEVILGKWIGLAASLLAYSVAVSVLEFAVVDLVSGFTPPDPVLAGLYLFGESAILLTVVLLLSTRLSTLASGVVGIALFGTAWLAGVVGSLGAGLNIPAMRTIGSVARYVLPTDGLWHGAMWYLEPQSFVGHTLGEAAVAAGNPFFASSAPAWTYLVWVAVWFLAVLGAAIASFERREL